MLDGVTFSEPTPDALTELFASPTLDEIREHLRCLRNMAEKGSLFERLTTAAGGENVVRYEGDYWTIAYRGRVSRLRDRLGIRSLACLVDNPGREIAALDLVAMARPGDSPGGTPPPIGRREAEALGLGLGQPRADAVLDAKAVDDYRSRLSALREELENAISANDPGRRGALEREIGALVTTLRSALGLGGRGRCFSSEAERARLNVTRAMRSALAGISRSDPALGQHLARTIHTGALCGYDPDPEARPVWEVRMTV